MRSHRPILLLELNEIPWRLWDLYLNKSGYPKIKKFIQESQQLTTRNTDSGELSPWITWPTLHRGMDNREHGIQNLGQDPSTFKGEPIWDVYLKDGHSVGICGSLQSWPPKDPGPNGFFIPDTFAATESTLPKKYEPLQKFNLDMVRKNGRVVRADSMGLKKGLALSFSLPGLGIKPQTIFKAGKQILLERVDSRLRARRPIFQTMLFWDVFKTLFDPKNPPSFSTFFTNHVAGVMHRYWHLPFPEDFDAKAELPKTDPRLMDFAMELVDQMFSDVLKLQELNPELLVVAASSMGQEKVDRPRHEGIETLINDIPRFLQALGFDSKEVKPLLAMVPQTSYRIENSKVRAKFKHLLETARTASGKKLFSVDEQGTTLTATLKTPPKKDAEEMGFWLNTRSTPTMLKWEDAGIEHVPVDAGTAYHIPEGFFCLKGQGIEPSTSRRKILSTEVKSLLLEKAGLSSPSETTHHKTTAVV